MKTLKEFMNEVQATDLDTAIAKLKKLGGKVFGNVVTHKKTKQQGKLGKNGDVIFLLKPDGSFIRGKTASDVLGKDWKAEKPKRNVDSLAAELQAGQEDGDIVDMLLAKGHTMKDIDKAAKSLGAKNVNDFLDQ